MLKVFYIDSENVGIKPLRSVQRAPLDTVFVFTNEPRHILECRSLGVQTVTGYPLGKDQADFAIVSHVAVLLANLSPAERIAIELELWSADRTLWRAFEYQCAQQQVRCTHVTGDKPIATAQACTVTGNIALRSVPGSVIVDAEELGFSIDASQAIRKWNDRPAEPCNPELLNVHSSSGPPVLLTMMVELSEEEAAAALPGVPQTRDIKPGATHHVAAHVRRKRVGEGGEHESGNRTYRAAPPEHPTARRILSQFREASRVKDVRSRLQMEHEHFNQHFSRLVSAGHLQRTSKSFWKRADD